MQKYFPGKMHLVIRPVETLPIQISMSAVGKLRISMCCTLMCFLPCCSEAYNIQQRRLLSDWSIFPKAFTAGSGRLEKADKDFKKQQGRLA